MQKYIVRSKRQRCMRVELTGDRAERPPSRFEDGETHRGPYTSMIFLSCHASSRLSSEGTDGFYADLGEVFDHELSGLESW